MNPMPNCSFKTAKEMNELDIICCVKTNNLPLCKSGQHSFHILKCYPILEQGGEVARYFKRYSWLWSGAVSFYHLAVQACVRLDVPACNQTVYFRARMNFYRTFSKVFDKSIYDWDYRFSFNQAEQHIRRICLKRYYLYIW